MEEDMATTPEEVRAAFGEHLSFTLRGSTKAAIYTRESQRVSTH
jgi:hypothetical protein